MVLKRSLANDPALSGLACKAALVAAHHACSIGASPHAFEFIQVAPFLVVLLFSEAPQSLSSSGTGTMGNRGCPAVSQGAARRFAGVLLVCLGFHLHTIPVFRGAQGPGKVIVQIAAVFLAPVALTAPILITSVVFAAGSVTAVVVAASFL
ncbi:hypothetical protein B0H17DRAFT_1216022 [Mycena rosella]|uniref:Uncharacterized protein n=1 Tax=Mycena rosella TaxID=1033263 RepID=A0AAD7CDI7_MYCRO|nr:hypothetical protein B0H17DRAFT_1216022 [Mycena rosella]